MVHSRVLCFGYYIKQILNVFIRAIVRNFPLGERLNLPFHRQNGTFHPLPHENILTITRIKTFIIVYCSVIRLPSEFGEDVLISLYD
jgi:hypothetical protein